MAQFVKIGTMRASWQWPAYRNSLTREPLSEVEKHALVLNEVRAHLKHFEGSGVDLVVTPEAVEGGQTPEMAESLDQPGPYLQAYLDFAKHERCFVAGSCKLREKGDVYNAVAFIGPKGAIGRYHKTFLTEGERMIMASGKGAVVVDTPIGRIGAAICFDLNFEPLRKEYAALKPKIIVFSSAYHGGLAQMWWAYECRAYFVSSHLNINCGIRDPFGRPVAWSSDYGTFPMARVNLDYAMVHLDGHWEKLPAIVAKYRDEVMVDIPPDIGSALLVSNSTKRTAMDIAREFQLELLDDYFTRSTAANLANRR